MHKITAGRGFIKGNSNRNINFKYALYALKANLLLLYMSYLSPYINCKQFDEMGLMYQPESVM